MTNEQQMFRISGREPVLRNEDWIRILFDNRDPLEVPISLWVDFRLKVGSTLDFSTLTELEREASVRSWKSLALRYVSYRPRTKSEMTRYLTRKGATDAVVRRVVEMGEQEGWLRDTEYVRQYVGSRQGKSSRREVSWKLGQRGVRDRDLNVVLDAEWSPEQEYHAALKTAEKYLRSHSKRADEKLRQRLWAHLQRKGYDFDVSRKVLEVLASKWESIAYPEFLDND